LKAHAHPVAKLYIVASGITRNISDNESLLDQGCAAYENAFSQTRSPFATAIKRKLNLIEEEHIVLRT
jgi:hypothetical protein